MSRLNTLVGWLLLALMAVLAVPFLLRPRGEEPLPPDRTLAILSPHNEAVKVEFARAFRRWHEQRFGVPAGIDWRNVGGTSDIVRYLDGEFEAANRAKLDGIGVDLFFGGGVYDHARQGKRNHLAPCGIRQRHPEWLDPAIIPACVSGEPFYDAEDRWYGCCLTSFGICYNTDLLEACGLTTPPAHWADLADPRYARQVALADPSKSGSINKAFELLIQEQMAAALAARGRAPAEATPEDLAAGWLNGLDLLRRISANARYFTDSAGKVVIDVAQGNATAGMCIDYYGRFEGEMVVHNEGSARMVYITPGGGSSLSVDPVSLLRGAPHRELAERFVEFCLEVEGQQLWNYRAGEPGGPTRYSLRRLPIRKDLYTPEHLAHMADADVMPYATIGDFTYRPEWTGALFSLIRNLMRAMCIDAHTELTDAWAAIIAAGGPDRCPAAMAALTAIPPDVAFGQTAATAKRMSDKLAEVRIMRDWTVFFRTQYREARRLAEDKNIENRTLNVEH